MMRGALRGEIERIVRAYTPGCIVGIGGVVDPEAQGDMHPRRRPGAAVEERAGSALIGHKYAQPNA